MMVHQMTLGRLVLGGALWRVLALHGWQPAVALGVEPVLTAGETQEGLPPPYGARDRRRSDVRTTWVSSLGSKLAVVFPPAVEWVVALGSIVSSRTVPGISRQVDCHRQEGQYTLPSVPTAHFQYQTRLRVQLRLLSPLRSDLS